MSSADPQKSEPSTIACATCGTPLAAQLGGHCPLCLLGLADESAGPDPVAGSEGATSGFRNRRFGDYELLEEIARGGMGVVYRARQVSLNREVALKMILAGELAGPDALRMFRREAHAAAQLHHPNIVPVHEIGEHELQHYFSMRLVPGGRSIARWAEGRRGDWKALAEAVAKAARAVAFAHDHGVLHRDLKPSNILWDDAAGPQVTDFGLAKLLDEVDGSMTLSARVFGSPNYMAPEQAGGKDAVVTTATDVYGLGAVLYELLSGRPPFRGTTALDTIRRAVEQSPEPLKDVPRDLSTICLKCLEKDPARRYRSAAALADDLERFTRGEPVSAVPLTGLETAWRWARRRPQVAALLAVSVVSLVAGVVGISWQWRKAEKARRGEGAALARVTETVVDLYTHSGLTADEGNDPTRAALWFAKAAEASPDPVGRAENLSRQAAWRSESPFAVRAFQSDIGPVHRLAWNRAQTALIGRTQDRRAAIWDVENESRWQPGVPLEMENAVWANEAGWFVSVAQGTLRRTDYPSGRTLSHASCSHRTPVLAVSRDDRWIAVGGEAPFLWEVATGNRKPLPSAAGTPRLLEFSGDGRSVLVCTADKVGVCNVDSPEKFLFPPVACLPPTTPGFLGNDAFYTRVVDGVVSVMDRSTGRQTESYTNALPSESTPLFGSPDGRFITTSMAPVIGRPTGYTRFPEHSNRIEQADFTRDSAWLATACYDSVVRLVPLPGGAPVQKVGWHHEGAMGVAIAPDNRHVATSQSGGNLIRVWRLGSPPQPRRIPVAGDTGFRLSGDGRLVMASGITMAYTRLEKTRVHAVDTGEPVGPEIVPGGAIMNAAFAPDASWVALICSGLTHRADEVFARDGGSGNLQFWDFRAGRRLGEPVVLPAEPRGLAVHPSGRWVAGYTAKRELLEIDVATRAIRVLHATDRSHYSSDVYSNGDCRYSPDGRFLVGWAMRAVPVLWDRQLEKLLPAQPAGPSQVTDVDFNGGILSMASIQSRMEFLSLPDARPARPPLEDSDWVFLGRFSPEGDLFLGGGRAKTARVWNWREGTTRYPALRHEEEVFAGTFVPGTEWLATGGLDLKIRFWDRRTGLPLRSPLRPESRVLQLAATPDGRTLLCGNSGGDSLLLYDMATTLPKMELPVADALLLAEIDAAAEIRNGGLDPLNAAAWLRRWREFRTRHPDWHRWGPRG